MNVESGVLNVSSEEREAQANIPKVPASGTSQVNVGNIERIISVLGGAFLTYKAIQKPKSGWMAGGVAGSYLLYRGTTGYCPASAALGINTAHKESKPLLMQRSVSVNRSREDVYAFWRKLENLPRFMTHLKSVVQTTGTESHQRFAIFCLKRGFNF